MDRGFKEFMSQFFDSYSGIGITTVTEWRQRYILQAWKAMNG